MSGQCAWTANVWGHGKTAMLAAASRKAQEGSDEECMICRGDLPANVALKPCGHLVCFSCVETMRAKNIFRVDRGVKCPFCRGCIDRYELMDDSFETAGAIQEILNEANKAAGIAANDRLKACQTANNVGGSDLSSKASWRCSTCTQSNLWFRKACTQCRQANPTPKAATPVVKGASRPENQRLIMMCKEMNYPNLEKAFSDAGCLFQNQARAGGTDADVQLAFRGRGGDKLLKIAQTLADPETLKDVCMDPCGNYFAQDLTLALAAVRKALANSPPSSNSSYGAFRAAHWGLDPFGVLVQAVLPNFTELAMTLATYMLQKLAEHATTTELLDLAAACVPDIDVLMVDSKAVFVVLKILSALRERCVEGRALELAAQIADDICADVVNDSESAAASARLARVTHLQLGSKVLCASIGLALPRYNALRVGSAIVAEGATLSNHKTGISCLLALVPLQPVHPLAHELMRDMVCVLVTKLQGRLPDYCLSDDDRGPGLITAIVKRLADEQESGWIDSIVQELVGKGDVLAARPKALEVLKVALSCGALDQAAVDAHLSQLGELLGPDELQPIIDDVYNRMACLPPPPPPKYFKPSVMQPALQYLLQRGMPLRGPPPPPNGDAPPPQPTTSRTAALTPSFGSSASRPPEPAGDAILQTKYDMSYLISGSQGVDAASAPSASLSPPTVSRPVAPQGRWWPPAEDVVAGEQPQRQPYSNGFAIPAPPPYGQQQQQQQALRNGTSLPPGIRHGEPVASSNGSSGPAASTPTAQPPAPPARPASAVRPGGYMPPTVAMAVASVTAPAPPANAPRPALPPASNGHSPQAPVPHDAAAYSGGGTATRSAPSARSSEEQRQHLQRLFAQQQQQHYAQPQQPYHQPQQQYPQPQQPYHQPQQQYSQQQQPYPQPQYHQQQYSQQQPPPAQFAQQQQQRHAQMSAQAHFTQLAQQAQHAHMQHHMAAQMHAMNLRPPMQLPQPGHPGLSGPQGSKPPQGHTTGLVSSVQPPPNRLPVYPPQAPPPQQQQQPSRPPGTGSASMPYGGVGLPYGTPHGGAGTSMPPPHTPGSGARRAGVPVPVPSRPLHAEWTCGRCTYVHCDAEAAFLTCAVCDQQRDVPC